MARVPWDSSEFLGLHRRPRKLPEGTEQFTVLLVGGSDGLCDTIRLREVNQHFRHLAEDAARRGVSQNTEPENNSMEAFTVQIFSPFLGILVDFWMQIGRE